MLAHCSSCKQKREIYDTKQETMQNGSSAVSGKCTYCNGGIFTFGKLPKPAPTKRRRRKKNVSQAKPVSAINYHESYQKARSDWGVWFFCDVCEARIDIQPGDNHHKQLIKLMKKDGWHHVACAENPEANRNVRSADASQEREEPKPGDGYALGKYEWQTWYFCSICGGRIYIDSNQAEHESAIELMKVDGRGHRKCHSVARKDFPIKLKRLDDRLTKFAREASTYSSKQWFEKELDTVVAWYTVLNTSLTENGFTLNPREIEMWSNIASNIDRVQSELIDIRWTGTGEFSGGFIEKLRSATNKLYKYAKFVDTVLFPFQVAGVAPPVPFAATAIVNVFDRILNLVEVGAKMLKPGRDRLKALQDGR